MTDCNGNPIGVGDVVEVVKRRNARRRTERLRAAIEVRRCVKHWGQRHYITPRLVDEVFGRGDMLLALQPLNTRPNYYVVRIDKTWWSKQHDDNALWDHLDEIYDAIEYQFGECRDGECPKHPNGKKGNCTCWFPVFLSDCGTGWWELHWPRGFGRSSELRLVRRKEKA